MRTRKTYRPGMSTAGGTTHEHTVSAGAMTTPPPHVDTPLAARLSAKSAVMLLPALAVLEPKNMTPHDHSKAMRSPQACVKMSHAARGSSGSRESQASRVTPSSSPTVRSPPAMLPMSGSSRSPTLVSYDPHTVASESMHPVTSSTYVTPLCIVAPDRNRSRRVCDAASSTSGVGGGSAASVFVALRDVHVKPTAVELPLVAKQDAMDARASRVRAWEPGKSSNGGAAIEIAGRGIAARVTVIVYGALSMLRKLVTTKTISYCRPPSSCAPVSSAVTELPIASNRAATS